MTLAWRTGRIRQDREGDGEADERAQMRPPAAPEIDAATIVAARADLQAFAPIYRAYAPGILRYCQWKLGSADLADDATAQTFTRAITALPRFDTRQGDPGATFRSWLYTIAHNVIVDAQRRHRRHLSLDHAPTGTWLHLNHHLTDPERTPEEHAIAADTARRLTAAMAELPARQREIVELRLAGLRGAEIGRVLGMSHGAVKSAQHRAYATLRDRLGELHTDPEADR